jgi:hypothetical protein
VRDIWPFLFIKVQVNNVVPAGDNELVARQLALGGNVHIVDCSDFFNVCQHGLCVSVNNLDNASVCAGRHNVVLAKILCTGQVMWTLEVRIHFGQDGTS